MIIKKLLTAAFLLFSFFAVTNHSYSQDDKNTGIRIEIPVPDFPIIIGDTYDRDGYDKDGYDRYGYDRYGYDRSGYDRYGYDRYGYDRNGYDRNGNYRNDTKYYDKEKRHKHHDNGKHKGWYKNNKKNKHTVYDYDDDQYDDIDDDRDDD